MKKAILYASLFLIMIASVFASVDSDCTENGFDFGIAKYTPTDDWDWADGMESAYALTVDEINTGEFDWTAIPGVAGVYVKAGSKNETTAGGTSGTVYCINYTNPGEQLNCHDISHITFCGNEDLPPPPCIDCEPPNGVPEFSLITLVIAVIGAGLGLAVLRKH